MAFDMNQAIVSGTSAFFALVQLAKVLDYFTSAISYKLGHSDQATRISACMTPLLSPGHRAVSLVSPLAAHISFCRETLLQSDSLTAT